MKKTPKTKTAPAVVAPVVETVLVMRTCNADMTAYGGFKWPESGLVEAPDWKPIAKCGHGLHGLLWGVGSASYLDLSDSAKGLVVRVAAELVVDLGGKVKFPRGEVVFCGDLKGAADYICANGGAGRAVVRGTATAGDRGTATAGVSGTATAGDRGTATAGDSGTATAGYSGTATAGDRGTATAGVRGTATAGSGGTICILYWSGKRYKSRIAQVKDEDGDGELEPNVPYRLNERGEFVKAPVGKKDSK